MLDKKIIARLLRTTKQRFLLVVSVLPGLLIMPHIVGAQQVTAVELVNPLKVSNITELLEALLGVVVVLATPIIVFFIIYSGFLYVTAQGNPEQIKQASRSLTYAIIGGVIVIGAFAIATMVKNLVASF